MSMSLSLSRKQYHTNRTATLRSVNVTVSGVEEGSAVLTLHSPLAPQKTGVFRPAKHGCSHYGKLRTGSHAPAARVGVAAESAQQDPQHTGTADSRHPHSDVNSFAQIYGKCCFPAETPISY